jgi:beta-glucosidase
VYAKGCEVVDATWPDSEILPQEPTKEEQAQMDEALAVAGGADVIIAVLGGTQRTCGENRSRSSIELPGHQNRLLARLIATGKPVVVVLVNGRPLSVNYADKYANAILEAWYPGSFGGTAVADALFGDYNPGGKLSVTFPKSVGQIPFNFPYKPNSQVDGNITPGPKGDKSRVNGALYDFGYGLSYTTFEYSALRLSSGVVTEGNDVEVSFDVTNTGSMAGDEIVQLYLHDRLSSITVYEKVLRGFERIHLVPGQTRTVTLTLRPEDFSLITAGFRRVVEPGVFDIYVGASSKDIRLVGQVTAPSLIDFGKLDGQGPELASKYETDYGMTYGQPEDKSRRLLKGDDYTFPMDRVTGTVTVTWAPDSNCDFEIQVTNGGGLFNTVYTGSVNDGGIKSYYFPRTNVSEARVLVTKGAATIYSAE